MGDTLFVLLIRFAVRAWSIAAAVVNVLIPQTLLGLVRQSWWTRYNYRAFGKAQTWLSREWNLESGLMDFEKQYGLPLLKSGDRVLVTSVGGGREAFELKRRGFQVVGIEGSQRLHRRSLELASGAGTQPDLRHGTVQTLGPSEGLFGSVWVGWQAYSYMGSRRMRVRFLERCCGLVVDGGSIIASFYVRTGFEEKQGSLWRLSTGLKLVVAAITFNTRKPDAAEHLSIQNLSCSLLPTEVEAEFEEAGFGDVVVNRAMGCVTARKKTSNATGARVAKDRGGSKANMRNRTKKR